MSKISSFSRIHFIGIGGVSMSALAKLMIFLGHEVSGSDAVWNTRLQEIIEMGGKIFLGHEESNARNANLIVYTQSINEENVELIYARKNKIPTIRRDIFLSKIASDYGRVVAISGSHGKTTITAMLANVFLVAGEKFTAHIGGDAIGLGNIVYKGYDTFITEACEYKRSFLALNPDVAVITSTEFDHPDSYKNKQELIDTYMVFGSKINNRGRLILHNETDVYNMHKCAYVPICSYGDDINLDCTYDQLIKHKNGCYGFRVRYEGQPKSYINLNIAGKYNVMNALAVYATCMALGIDERNVVKGLESFKGVERRLQYRGKVNGAKVYVDYAHHPTEIRAVFDTVKELTESKVKLVFQPHTFSRTEALFDEFVGVLRCADEVYVIKEYGARESRGGKSAYELFEEVKKEYSGRAFYFDNIISLAKELVASLKEGEILLVLGAGDVDRLVDVLI